MSKARFSIFTKIDSAKYRAPKWKLRPETPDDFMEGYTKEVVDMNTYLFELLKVKNDRSLTLLEQLYGYTYRLLPTVRKAYSEFIDKLTVVYPSFIDFLNKNPMIDAYCSTSFKKLNQSFCYIETSVYFTEQALIDFKEVFLCKVRKYKNRNFEFLIDPKLPEEKQQRCYDKIKHFLDMFAGNSFDYEYDTYVKEFPDF